jgi:hypothetical protein
MGLTDWVLVLICCGFGIVLMVLDRWFSVVALIYIDCVCSVLCNGRMAIDVLMIQFWL